MLSGAGWTAGKLSGWTASKLSGWQAALSFEFLILSFEF
jgi:hypothetical protein